MANAKLAKLLKEARTGAGLTQEKLARAAGVTAGDISRAERGEGDLTQNALKLIAKATGVTQASLLAASKPAAAKKTTKPAAKTAKAAKATAAKPAASKAAKPKTPAAAGLTMRVTATEKRLVEAYRAADADSRKKALATLKGESAGDSLLNGDLIADGLSNLVGSLLGGK